MGPEGELPIGYERSFSLFPVLLGIPQCALPGRCFNDPSIARNPDMVHVDESGHLKCAGRISLIASLHQQMYGTMIENSLKLRGNKFLKSRDSSCMCYFNGLFVLTLPLMNLGLLPTGNGVHFQLNWLKTKKLYGPTVGCPCSCERSEVTFSQICNK
jgi:hypothetical protein